MKSFNIYFICIFATVICVSSCKTYKAKRVDAVGQLEMVKENALLVRLNSHNNKVEALRKASEFEEAERLLQNDIEENQKTIEAFRENYTFSKVYFFQSSDGNKLKNGEYDQVTLFDTDNNEIHDKAFLKNGYLVATFSSVYQYQLVYEDGEQIRVPIAGIGGLPALVVLDKDYIQLSNPFPFRVPTMYNEDFKKGAVKELDLQFHQFYRKHVWRIID